MGTPYEDFRKEFLTKPKGYSIPAVIERALEYEVIKASMDSLIGIKSMSDTHTHSMLYIRPEPVSFNQIVEPHHERHACPEYKDSYYSA